MKHVGNWWNDNSIELVEVDGSVYALNGWNGEKFIHCWKCSGEFYHDASKEEYELTPIYKENEYDSYDIVGYEVF